MNWVRVTAENLELRGPAPETRVLGGPERGWVRSSARPVPAPETAQGTDYADRETWLEPSFDLPDRH